MRVIYITLAIVIIDQISKLLVKGFAIPFLNFNYDGMYYGQSIPIIGDFFRLTYIENPGMAFGFDPGENFKLAISLFSLIASIGLAFYLYLIREKSFSLRLSIAFILGGAIGNLIDRTFYGVLFGYAPLFYGKVVDFFDFDFFNFTIFGVSYDRWPIFNIADASVTIGVIILILFYKNEDKEESEKIESEKKIDSESETSENFISNESSQAELENISKDSDEQNNYGEDTSSKSS
ncbi:MAG: signal peptidase II [Ignavibacterium sp.]|nr:signal peptidase II [Ignavibacterium sp.]MCX7610877.1 signal peptidase II [Ignavibacterium sp.]MDW8374660.1 signal peptidase II [Ignavibacteriales bacterium]